MFDKIKGLMEMQKKMQQAKRELESTAFEVASPDGLVKLTMNGSQEVSALTIQGELTEAGKRALEQALKDVYNKAIKRSQDIAAAKMKEITGLNIPGLS
ncbi:MAG: YbaB/EbfC family nucleoid-associated protein [Candidatus Omnitrophica bacterium]|nr:YbaB/EbfC family nucleoid-associated protein [Candidatus Omnitrophota bacterium]